MVCDFLYRFDSATNSSGGACLHVQIQHTVTPAPASPLWCSRAPGCPSLRTPATIITCISARWIHLEFFTLLIAPLYPSAPQFVPCVSIDVVVFSTPALLAVGWVSVQHFEITADVRRAI
jgi:hypothetical protein